MVRRRLKSSLVWTDVIRTHVADGADPAPDPAALRDVHRQTEVTDPHVTQVIEQDVLRLTVPVYNALGVKVLQPTQYLPGGGGGEGGVRLGYKDHTTHGRVPSR